MGGGGFSSATAPDRAESHDVSAAASQDCIMMKGVKQSPHTSWHTHTRSVRSDPLRMTDDKHQPPLSLLVVFKSPCLFSFLRLFPSSAGSEDHSERVWLHLPARRRFRTWLCCFSRHFWVMWAATFRLCPSAGQHVFNSEAGKRCTTTFENDLTQTTSFFCFLKLKRCKSKFSTHPRCCTTVIPKWCRELLL